MTIVVEDGTGVTGANSYVTELELTSYADARGVTLSGDPASLLIRAADYSETLSFQGRKASQDQPLQWPRTGVTIDGYTVPSDEIPAALISAQIVTALAIDQGRDPLAPIGPGVKREKVDVLEVEYQDGASSRALSVDVIRAWSKLTAAGSGANQMQVVRV